MERSDEMRLTREHVTQVMLPVYVIGSMWVGITYTITPRTRLLQTPALEYADRVLDIRAWGALFVAVAVLLLVAVVWGNRWVSEYALLLGFICCTIWTVVLVVASFHGAASPAAGAFPFIGAAAQLASYRTVRTWVTGRPSRSEGNDDSWRTSGRSSTRP